MKRKNRKAASLEPEKMVRMYAAERVTVAVRVTGALWTELGRRLRSLQLALEACAAGGEAPVRACRARVKLMLGAWRAFTTDCRALLASPLGDDEHLRWMDEYSQVMKTWLATFEGDLRDYSELREGFEPEDGIWFVPEVAVALGRVVEVYDDWSLIAWPLSGIDAPGGYPESEVKKFDVDLKRVEDRIRARRVAVREESKRVTA
jgi:hypothetical protein